MFKSIISFFIISLASLNLLAHDDLPGYSHIVGGDCSVEKSDLSIVFSTKKYGKNDIYIYKGLRNIGNPNTNLLAKGNAEFSRIIFFPVNYLETLRIDFDESLQKILGRKMLTIASRISNADTEGYDMGFLATATNDDPDINVKCNLFYEETNEDLAQLDSRLIQTEHPSLCKIEYFETHENSWIEGCTATVVSSNKLLTAAHCEESFHRQKTRILCGGQKEYLHVDKWTQNPEHFNVSMNSVDNSRDVSVIQTVETINAPSLKIEYNLEKTKSLLLNTKSCFHYGMGVRSDDSVGNLYKTIYTIPSPDFGGVEYVKYIFDHSEMIASDPSQFLRPGDSGGPIICRDENNEEIIIGVHVMTSVSSTAAFSAIMNKSEKFLENILK